MDRAVEFLNALNGALRALPGTASGFRYASNDCVREGIRIRAGRNLRRAATGTITELDTDVLEDLMKIVKKLGTQAVDKGDRLEEKFKLALRLMEFAVDKSTPKQPDNLIWIFNKMYQEADRLMELENRKTLTMEGEGQWQGQ